MGRKRTARATPIKIPRMFQYEIAISHGDKLQMIDISATRIETDMDTLHVYNYIGTNEEKVAEFRDWAYYLILVDDPNEFYSPRCAKVNPDELPKDFGVVK